MIHAMVDTLEHKQIVRFEVGPKTAFDARHAGDPMWFFLDSYVVKYRANLSNFLTNPRKYRINEFGDIYVTDDLPIIIDPDNEIPTVPFGYSALTGPDGRYLRGEDGYYLYGIVTGFEPPPEGMVYLIDPDYAILKDPDGRYLAEEADNTRLLTDDDNSLLTDGSGGPSLSDA